MNTLRILTVLILLVAAAENLPGDVFQAAAQQVDITPPAGIAMWGYSARGGVAAGVLDPLYARVLVLDDGASRIALVTLDLGRTFGPASMKLVRERVKSSATVNTVFFFASHTHSGPVIGDRYPEGETPAWETTALDRISAAIERAARRLTPARIGTGLGATYIGHNRRFVQPDGTVKMMWRNATKRPTSPVDPAVGVLRVDNARGEPLAILVNYSCHPVVLGPDNLRYSADFPGALAKVVEKSFETAPVCFFLQGGAGDINPYFDKTPLVEDGARVMRETGEQLGKEAARVSLSITTRVPKTPTLKYALDTRHFKMRWDVEKLLVSLEGRMRPATLARYRKYLTTPLDCPVMTLLIENEIALMGMPGEPFVDLAIDFRGRSPAKTSFFVGYANGYFAYFPTIEAAVVGGYGADSLTTRAEVGAGEAMVDHAIVTLHRMLGHLKSLPGR